MAEAEEIRTDLNELYAELEQIGVERAPNSKAANKIKSGCG